MKVAFRDSFAKDLKAVGDASLLKRVREVIEAAERADSLIDLPNLKKLKGNKTSSELGSVIIAWELRWKKHCDIRALSEPKRYLQIFSLSAIIMNMRIQMGLAGALLGTALAFGMIAVSSVHGQTPAKQAQAADSITTFWEKFKTAVIKGDKRTVAALTRFPVARGYGMTSIRNSAQLRRRFRELFFTETDAAKCFPKAKPVVEKERPNEFTISCPFARDGGNEDPFVYTFTRTRTGWKFISFENINE